MSSKSHHRQTKEKGSLLDEMCGTFMIYNVYALSLMVSICTILSVWFDIPTEDEKLLFGNAYWIIRYLQRLTNLTSTE